MTSAVLMLTTPAGAGVAESASAAVLMERITTTRRRMEWDFRIGSFSFLLFGYWDGLLFDFSTRIRVSRRFSFPLTLCRTTSFRRPIVQAADHEVAERK